VNNRRKKSIHELFLEGTPIDRAIARGVREALLRHKLLGQSIVVWKDGRTAEIPAEQIVIPPEPDKEPPPP
jgi:hypothetical protein